MFWLWCVVLCNEKLFWVVCSGLHKHMAKIHLGIRPFICDKCGASYSDEPELRLHIARHAESKPYSCNLCSYSTFQKGSLRCKCSVCSGVVVSDKDVTFSHGLFLQVKRH